MVALGEVHSTLPVTSDREIHEIEPRAREASRRADA
jgi:hypothetical protein